MTRRLRFIKGENKDPDEIWHDEHHRPDGPIDCPEHAGPPACQECFDSYFHCPFCRRDVEQANVDTLVDAGKLVRG